MALGPPYDTAAPSHRHYHGHVAADADALDGDAGSLGDDVAVSRAG